MAENSKPISSQDLNQELDVTSKPETLDHQATDQATGSATNITLTEFSKFPDLPLELQLRIWRYAVSEPRIVEFNLTQIHCPPTKKRVGFRVRLVPDDNFSLRYGRDGYPGVLGASTDSRKEALKLMPEWKVDFNERWSRISRSTLKFFRQDLDTVYISFHHISSGEIDDRMKRLIGEEPTYTMDSWVDEKAVPMLSKLKVLQWAKTIAVDREIMDGFEELSSRSFWHWNTLMIQCSFVQMKHMIVLLKDMTSVYEKTPNRSGDVEMFVSPGFKRVIVRKRIEENVEEEDEENGEENDEEVDMMGDMHEPFKKNMEDEQPKTQHQDSDPTDLQGDETEIDEEMEDDDGTETDEEIEDDEKKEDAQPTTQRIGFKPIINNTEYAAHVLEELNHAKTYLDADPSNVRRTKPLTFQILSSE